MSAPSYIPLFGSDYLADTSHLSTEEHGAYLLLMIAAWRQHDCGLPLDDKKLARIVGMSPRKWALIRETILDFWQVDGGRIYQPRLLKEWHYACKKSESNRKSAEARWNKQVVENNDTTPCDRISERNAPQPQPQPIPYGIDSTADAVVHPGAENEPAETEPERIDPPPAPKVRPEHFVEIWNELARRIGRPTVAVMTDARRQTIKARLASHTIEDFHSVFAKVEASDFLAGRTQRWPGVTFDWLTKQANFIKVLEGNYDR